MRKTIILAMIVLFATTTLALAAWKIVDLVKEETPSDQVASSGGNEGGQAGSEQAAADAGAVQGETIAAGEDGATAASGESQSQDDPDQRYVTETQRHQNFFIALAEGRVKRLDAVATDYQPAGDPNTSFLYFTLTTTDGKKSDGTMVLKFDAGLWRIADIRQLQGDLGGGTNYVTPASFEDDLAREILELQEFLTKVAQGRLDYMIVDSVVKPTDSETILNGRVVGTSGRVQPSRMTLRKDYSIWHLTSIVSL